MIQVLLGPLNRFPGAKAVFLFLCIAFILVRFLIISTSWDHLHNLDVAVYEMPQYLDCVLSDRAECSSILPNAHIWGKSISAFALLPFRWIGANNTEAMAFYSLVLSFICFAFLVYLAAWRCGVICASVLGLLLLFPDGNYLIWSLTIWGGYPEAAALLAIPVFIFASANVDDNPKLFFAAGLTLGLVFSYSASIVYALLAVALTSVFAIRFENWLRHGIALAGGTILGSMPILTWMLIRGKDIERSPVEGAPASHFSDFVTFPSVENLREPHGNLAGFEFLGNELVIWIAMIAIAWAILFSLFGKQNERWKLIFPFSFGTAILALASFSFSQWIGIRHLLWLYPCSYFCIALFAGEDVFQRFLPSANKVLLWLEKGLKLILVLVVLAFQISTTIKLIQPSNFGVLYKFEGMDYMAAGVGPLVGNEIDEMNRLLKTKPYIFADNDFRQGIRRVFPETDTYHCCLWTSVPYRLQTLELPEGIGAHRPFYKGIGCGVAIKNDLNRQFYEELLQQTTSERAAWIAEGYEDCINPKAIRSSSAQ